jgi:CheY-like chemotaxis protein
MSESQSSRPENVVLIIDDDHAVRESVSGLLADEGFSPAGFADGISMPRMDGWDFRNAQRADPALKDIPVAVVTASGFSEGTIRLQFGDVPILRKPIHPVELLATVERLCGRTGGGPEADVDRN